MPKPTVTYRIIPCLRLEVEGEKVEIDGGHAKDDHGVINDLIEAVGEHMVHGQFTLGSGHYSATFAPEHRTEVESWLRVLGATRVSKNPDRV